MEAEPSVPQMQTRAKGKEKVLTEAETKEQFRQLKEDELQCQLLQQKIQEKKRMLEQMQKVSEVQLEELAPQ